MTQGPPTPAEIQTALTALSAAAERYDQADEDEKRARREATAAVNALNAAQKAVDAIMARVRQGAPSSSDWGRPVARRTTERGPEEAQPAEHDPLAGR